MVHLLALRKNFYWVNTQTVHQDYVCPDSYPVKPTLWQRHSYKIDQNIRTQRSMPNDAAEFPNSGVFLICNYKMILIVKILIKEKLN